MTHARRRAAPRPSARPARRVEPLDPPLFTGADDFDPAEVRHRHDGWTPERQTGFIHALAESGCVAEACKRVGISTTAAYALRRRVEAQSFRLAWDLALDHAIQRLADAAFSRALHGVAQPIFYQGEQIGERRRYDERLTMFLLRYRDPVRYGAWLDGCRAERVPDAAAITLAQMTDAVEADAYARDAGDRPPPPRHRHQPARYVTEADEEEQQERAARAREEAEERRDEARREAEWNAYLETRAGRPDPGADCDGDVPSTSPTSALSAAVPTAVPALAPSAAVTRPAAPNPPAPRRDSPERRWSG